MFVHRVSEFKAVKQYDTNGRNKMLKPCKIFSISTTVIQSQKKKCRDSINRIPYISPLNLFRLIKIKNLKAQCNYSCIYVITNITQHIKRNNPDRWEVGTWSTLHPASNTLLYAYMRCKWRAHLWKCDWSWKEVHLKCCTSSALPDDMGTDNQGVTVVHERSLLSAVHNYFKMEVELQVHSTSVWDIKFFA